MEVRHSLYIGHRGRAWTGGRYRSINDVSVDAVLGALGKAGFAVHPRHVHETYECTFHGPLYVSTIPVTVPHGTTFPPMAAARLQGFLVKTSQLELLLGDFVSPSEAGVLKVNNDKEHDGYITMTSKNRDNATVEEMQQLIQAREGVKALYRKEEQETPWLKAL